MKDELGGEIMKKMVGLRAKSYSCLKENNYENKKAKGTKKCLKKRKLKFRDYKNCLKSAQTDGTLKYLEKEKFNVGNLRNL